MTSPKYTFNFLKRSAGIFNLNRLRKKYIQQKKEESKKIRFFEDLEQFNTSKNNSENNIKTEDITLLPFLNDKTEFTSFDPHYIYHPAWAARILSKTKPEFHIDISSTVSFCSIVSAFIPVHFYDYRPANIKLSNLAIAKGDLMALPFENSSVKSISCMHTIEHIGLGRYGDPIDYDGDVKAMNELQRVLAVNGTLLFVTPVGRRRIEFNAHRIYNFEDITKAFGRLKLVEFSMIPDNFEDAGLLLNPPPQLVNSQDWGCGCFWFTKQ